MLTKQQLAASFGTKIRDARVCMSLTQVDLASKLNINRAQLASLETGRTWVGIEAFYRLVSFLNLRIDKRTFEKKGNKK
jgi:transcriptional regulator with XRE-family HTH domain